MHREFEIEFKNLVTKEEFNRLRNHFSIKSSSFSKQINHYFDTKDLKLKALGSALRIRWKNNRYTLTFKQPDSDGLLETHETLTERDAKSFIKEEVPPESELLHILSINYAIQPSQLRNLGTLVTTRSETNYRSGLLVLDYSTYLGQEDYELEFEVKNRLQGELEFQQLLKQFAIPKRETPNKIQRLFNKRV